MNSMEILKYIICIGLTVTPLIVEYCFKKRGRKRVFDFSRDKKSDYEFIFTNANGSGCRQHIYMQCACSVRCCYNSLMYIVNVIKTARYSICMCMYLITSFEVAEALELVHKRGVKVRVITDNEMGSNPQSKIEFLKSKGNYLQLLIFINNDKFKGFLLKHSQRKIV